MSRSFFMSLIAVSLAFFAIVAAGQTSSDKPAALSELTEVPITVDNFVRAATDQELAKYVSLARGVNRLFHFREPTPVDDQPTIRMNRDTLYSVAVIDISKSATLELPDAGDRYMSTMVVNQDHYINSIFDGGGTYTLDMETFDTPYVIIFVRTLVDPSNPDDVSSVNALQDAMSISAGASRPFVPPNYDEEGFADMVSALLPLGPFVPDASRMFGSKDEVDGFRHVLGTAGGWGGLPETEAFYVNVAPNLPPKEYRIEVPANVPVGAFWSISLYNGQGFFAPNDQDAYTVSSVTGERNGDGSMTVHLGGCDDDRINCLPIMEGWNYTVRLYRPDQSVLDGSWIFPVAQPVN